MSLQFYLGGSGSGKSTKLYTDILNWAQKEPETNFLFLVPDQFTMQTQIDLVEASVGGGIMNIDVLSFSRLSHRVFEELGCDDRVVLDDTGKSLVLRFLASSLSDRLPVLGSNLNKVGFIHEIKSVISEFKQYNINCSELDEMITFSNRKGMLNSKLKDLKTIYEEFNNYICNKYITAEETITLLTERIGDSNIVKDAVVVLDGFTGFTPVQYRLIQRLMELTKRVIVSITVDIEAEPYGVVSPHELFGLSKKTIKDLQQAAREVNVGLEADVLLKNNCRFSKNRELLHLEKHLLRYPIVPFEGEVSSVSITEAASPEDEIVNVCKTIKNLVLNEGYMYRDIAIVCGDLATYSDGLVKFGKVYDLPVYIDETKGLTLNPFIEYIRSALMIVRDNFSYDSMFHFLRCGFLDIDVEDIDILDNYVLKFGIKGKKKWTEAFSAFPFAESKGEKEEAEENENANDNVAMLMHLNQIREKIVSILLPIMKKKGRASTLTEGLYEFILNVNSEEKLSAYEDYFLEMGKPEKAQEYSQVYGLIMGLLDQIHSLIPDEELTIDEFIKILDSGFDELDVGTIPGGVDRIIVGDIERSRIGNAGIIFFMGVNDGNIPRANSKGGLISDIDREFLKESGIELSPTPREQIFTQRLYLYMNMTKPKERLCVSYSRTDSSGKGIGQSYLIGMLKELFPKLEILKSSASKNPEDEVFGIADGLTLLAEGLREYSEDGLRIMNYEELSALCRTLLNNPDSHDEAEKLLESAFFRYEGDLMNKETAALLFGETLSGTVSRLETFSSCAYAHFLTYGMELGERKEFTFERNDLGSVFHSVLKEFSVQARQKGYTLLNFPDEMLEGCLGKIVEDVTANYNESVLNSSFANSFMVERIFEILRLSLKTTREQLDAGAFIPGEFEKSFKETFDIEGNSKVTLRGIVDRVDVCHTEEGDYIKIVDYKSSSKDVDFAKLYYGLQLQLPFYMISTLKRLQRSNPGVAQKMAAMLYYCISDPIIDSDEEMSEEMIFSKIAGELRPKGIVTEDRDILLKLDRGLSEPGYSSKTVPVKLNKDGSFDKSSKVISKEDFEILEEFVTDKTQKICKSILDGHIEALPKKYADQNPCDCCRFKTICRFDPSLGGFRAESLKKMDAAEAFLKMKEGKINGN